MNGYGGRSKNSRPYEPEYGKGFGPAIPFDLELGRSLYGQPEYGRVHQLSDYSHRDFIGMRPIGLRPIGYRRLDRKIREDICDFLTDHPRIDASDIQVHVKKGVVILEGRTETSALKYLVEELAEMVPGVRDVQNEISAEPFKRHKAS